MSNGFLTRFASSYLMLILMIVIMLTMVTLVFSPAKPVTSKLKITVKSNIPQTLITSIPTVDEGIKNTLKSFENEQASSSGTIGSATSQSPAKIDEVPMLDLVGPWQCDHAGISLSIKDKNIKGSFISDKGAQYALVQGDCAYLWSNLKEGTKQCGIGTYLDILAPMLGSADMINTLMQSMGEKAGKVDAAGLIASCKKTPLKSTVFTLPTSIKWVETMN